MLVCAFEDHPDAEINSRKIRVAGGIDLEVRVLNRRVFVILEHCMQFWSWSNLTSFDCYLRSGKITFPSHSFLFFSFFLLEEFKLQICLIKETKSSLPLQLLYKRNIIIKCSLNPTIPKIRILRNSTKYQILSSFKRLKLGIFQLKATKSPLNIF